MIEPDFLEELDRFEVSFDRQVDTVRQGGRRSLEIGEGQRFSDYRQYSPGDDIRLVDWKLLARTDELHVKQFEAERELVVHVLLDSSASMDFGEGDAHKFEFGAKIGLGFAYLAAEAHDDFRVSTFDDHPERLDGGRANRGEVLALVDRLNEVELDRPGSFREPLETYAAGISSRSLVVVVSDCLAPPDEIEAGLDALARNDVVLAHVVAPEERELPATGDTIFEPAETSGSLRAYFGGRLKRRYQDRLADHLAAVEASATRTGAAYAAVDTGADFFDAFTSVWDR
jgi:uncharacterized protein (DUF58 family)